VIRVEGLTKRYAGFPALRGIAFSVEAGEIVGFLGPNGAGKTTTLRILSGYMPSTEGRATVAGYDVARHSREVRLRTGYLPEDVPLYRDLTVTGYLRYIGGLKEIPRSRLRSEVDRVVGLTGLEAVARRQVGKCSRGYRQRTGLAQALLGDPAVLLMDEPTSGLDPNQVVDVRELIRRLSGEKTVLLSSHILSEVTQICGRVVIINEGALVGTGTPEELARKYGGDAALVLRVTGSVDAGLLGSVPGVVYVREAGDARYRLGVTDPETVAVAVARAVHEAGGGLLELRPERVDLESVFRRLTREETGA
jgi:ABC-2 type transport system ATP-binding protein